MSSCLRASLLSLPLLAFTTACVDTGNLFGGGDPAGGSPGTGGSPATGAGAPMGGSPDTGGGPPNGGEGPMGAGSEGGAPPTCGDGNIDAEEDCDGADLGGLDCTDLEYLEPEGLACSDTCKLDTSDCKTECGNGQPEPGEVCDDGNDQPNDGCANDCTVELGSCASPEPVALALGTVTVSGTTGGVSAMAPTNAQNCQGASGPEKVFEVTPAAAGYLTAYIPSQGTGMDSVLYAQTGCGGAAVQRLCNDNFGTPSNDGGELLSFRVEAGVPVLIVVDGYQAADSGDFELSLDLSVGDDCDDPVPLTIEGDASVTVTGNTTGLTSNGNSNGLCQMAGAGPDVVYAVTHVQGGDYDYAMTPGPSFNTVIHARATCDNQETQVDCDSPVAFSDSSIGFDVNNDDVRFVYADGTSNSFGSYSILITH
jgi:cysteine-rich repeat protein